jgi:NitT/TauT family transport system ATP-binding protein
MIQGKSMLDQTKPTSLIDIRGVCRSFPKGSGEDLLVLEQVDLTIHSGEIVGLLGRSGSGKSTLLRIIAGLVAPSSGEAKCRGEAIKGPPNGVAMVFQSFALFPWLTVLQNVELGLEALGIDSAERRTRALAAIDLIGLDGFESAYPKELSGGMRQRVGFARALVVHPDLLLMDEPFSALDVLTAETLRTDLIDLWTEGRLPIKSVLMVTHNIEEAVLSRSNLPPAGRQHLRPHDAARRAQNARHRGHSRHRRRHDPQSHLFQRAVRTDRDAGGATL